MIASHPFRALLYEHVHLIANFMTRKEVTVLCQVYDTATEGTNNATNSIATYF